MRVRTRMVMKIRSGIVMRIRIRIKMKMRITLCCPYREMMSVLPKSPLAFKTHIRNNSWHTALYYHDKTMVRILILSSVNQLLPPNQI